MTSWEFTYWMALNRYQPFGEEVKDLRAGTIAAVIANVNRNTKAKPEPFVPADFTPWSADKEDEEKTPEPILLSDAAAQTKLLRATLFGKSR